MWATGSVGGHCMHAGLQAKMMVHELREDNRLLASEKRRAEGQLSVAQENVTKAEELLNMREK